MTRRTPAQYDWDALEFDEQILAKHFTKGRTRKIEFVVIHHMTILGRGTGSALDACFRTWQTRKASAHYGIDGQLVRQFVWDSNTAWATGSNVGNAGGISIEHANSATCGNWPIASNTIDTSVRLVAHLHKAKGLGRPTSNADGSSGTIRAHKSFKATACPGPYFMSLWASYVKQVQAYYDRITTSASAKPTAGMFTDVDSAHPFHSQIEWAARAGITNGYPDKTFRPGNPITRGDAAVMMFRAVGKDQLTDVPADHPHALAIGWFQGSRTARGFGDGTFRPSAQVTRVDAAIFLWRHAGEPQVDPAGGTFSDLGTVNATGQAACTWAFQAGVSGGWPQPDGRVMFKPGDSITRADWVVFLNRYLKG